MRVSPWRRLVCVLEACAIAGHLPFRPCSPFPGCQSLSTSDPFLPPKPSIPGSAFLVFPVPIRLGWAHDLGLRLCGCQASLGLLMPSPQEARREPGVCRAVRWEGAWRGHKDRTQECLRSVCKCMTPPAHAWAPFPGGHVPWSTNFPRPSSRPRPVA